MPPKKTAKKHNGGSSPNRSTRSSSSRRYSAKEFSDEQKPAFQQPNRLKESSIMVDETQPIETVLTHSNIPYICPDSGVCMAFGTNRKLIIEYFDNFENFDLIQTPIIMIGQPSANGFIRELRYEKHGYPAYAILKSSKDKTADNLVYEYIVGQFINEQCSIYPCFIQSYGLYYYTNKNVWKNFSSKKKNFTSTDLMKAIKKQPETDIYNYAKMCSESVYASIIIEHINNAKTVLQMMNLQNLSDVTDFTCNELLYIMYQIYMPLSKLYNKFTHYDLHDGNVLVYEPIKGKYIEYHYHLPNDIIVSFKSRYIAKIIDYGRCFFTYNKSLPGKTNPPEIYSELCREKKCEETIMGRQATCGQTCGFEWMESPDDQLHVNAFFINSTRPNVSHDLRLLYFVKNNVDNVILTLQAAKSKAIKSKNNELNAKYANEIMYIKLLQDILFDMLQYGIGIKKRPEQQYGTEENHKKGYSSKRAHTSNKINNVKDAEEAIRNVILVPAIKKSNNAKYSDPANELGKMHIYSNGDPMKFIPTRTR